MVFASLTDRLQYLLLSVLAAGPIPQHVAFVMDGNRRYARMNSMQVKQGHIEGFSALRKLLEVCLKLKIRCVSVYAFAIDNFKRSPEEVDALMQLLKDKLTELCQKGDLLDQYGVRIHIVGNISLFPSDVREAVSNAENKTRHNDKAILNICAPYASRDEMTTAVQLTVDDALENDVDLEDISTDTIDSNLMISRKGSPPLDILVRTSGVKRLSDYMLWQSCENTQIHFVPTYWPLFSFWDFVPIILDYQRKVWTKSAC